MSEMDSLTAMIPPELIFDLVFLPSCRCDFRDLVVGHVRQAGEDIPEISEGIEAASTAAFDNGVNLPI